MSRPTYRTSDRRRVRRLYLHGGPDGKGMTAREVAQQPKTPSRKTISRWAADEGYQRSKAEAHRLFWRRKRLRAWRQADEMVQGGATVAEAARRLDMTTDAVYTALSKELYR